MSPVRSSLTIQIKIATSSPIIPVCLLPLLYSSWQKHGSICLCVKHFIPSTPKF